MDITYVLSVVVLACIALFFTWLPMFDGSSGFRTSKEKPDAYWVGTSLVRDYDGKVLAQIVVRQGMMWGYHTGVSENDVVFGYVSEQYAKRAAESKCKVNVIQKKEGF